MLKSHSKTIYFIGRSEWMKASMMKYVEFMTLFTGYRK